MAGNPGGDKLKAEAKESFSKAAKLLGPNSFSKHLVAGTASGWFTGAVVGSAGKGIALVLGSSIILYQIAHHKGYVSSDLTTLRQLAEKKTNEIAKNSPAVSKMRTFATKNKAFSAGFLGGFLLGIAF